MRRLVHEQHEMLIYRNRLVKFELKGACLFYQSDSLILHLKLDYPSLRMSGEVESFPLGGVPKGAGVYKFHIFSKTP